MCCPFGQAPPPAEAAHRATSRPAAPRSGPALRRAFVHLVWPARACIPLRWPLAVLLGQARRLPGQACALCRCRMAGGGSNLRAAMWPGGAPGWGRSRSETWRVHDGADHGDTLRPNWQEAQHSCGFAGDSEALKVTGTEAGTGRGRGDREEEEDFFTSSVSLSGSLSHWVHLPPPGSRCGCLASVQPGARCPGSFRGVRRGGPLRRGGPVDSGGGAIVNW